MRWIVRGDIDGFFGLALDNLVQLLLIDGLCRFVLGFPPELIYLLRTRRSRRLHEAMCVTTRAQAEGHSISG